MAPTKITKQTSSSQSESGIITRLKSQNEQLEKLEVERGELVEKKEIEGVLNVEDEASSNTIENVISKYTSAKAKVTPIPESSAAAEPHTTEQHATEQHATEQHATEQHATEQHAAERNAAEQNAAEQNAAKQNTTVNAPDPVTTHANTQKSPLKHREIKKEHAEESKVSTNKYVNNLGMA
jgi:hypothetical protein